MSWLTKVEKQQNEKLFYGPAVGNRAGCTAVRRVAESAGRDVGTWTTRIVASQVAVNAVLAAKNLAKWGESNTKRFLRNRQIPEAYWRHANRIELKLLQRRLE